MVKIRYLGSKLPNEMRPFRPRSDKVHVSFQNIPELRYLIYSQLPDESADSSSALVICRGPDRHPAGLGIRLHRSKFYNIENLAAFAHALLFIENRPP